MCTYIRYWQPPQFMNQPRFYWWVLTDVYEPTDWWRAHVIRFNGIINWGLAPVPPRPVQRMNAILGHL